MLTSSFIAIYSIADRSRRRGFMPASLDVIVQLYLNDTEFLEEGRDIARNREASVPNLRRTVSSFIDDAYNLNHFREQINKALPAKDPWGARGPDFLME